MLFWFGWYVEGWVLVQVVDVLGGWWWMLLLNKFGCLSWMINMYIGVFFVEQVMGMQVVYYFFVVIQEVLVVGVQFFEVVVDCVEWQCLDFDVFQGQGFVFLGIRMVDIDDNLIGQYFVDFFYLQVLVEFVDYLVDGVLGGVFQGVFEYCYVEF